MEARVTKTAESQRVTLAKFAGKPEPNPVESVNMMRNSEEFSRSSASVNIRTVIFWRKLCKDVDSQASAPRRIKWRGVKHFLDQVAYKVRELDAENKKLYGKLLTNKRIYLSQQVI